MKHEKWLSCLTAACLAFALALAGVGCLVTAFDLRPVSFTIVAIFCGFLAVLCAVCFTVRHGVLGLVAGGALLLGALLREGRTILQIEALIHQISRFYDAAYGVGVVSWSGKDLSEVPVNGALLLIGGIVIVLTVWAVCHRKTVFFAAGVGFLPMAACFVVTDTIPDEKWIFLMALCMVLLIVPHSVRRKDEKTGVRLTAWLLIPAMLASMLLFWCNPQSTYESRMDGVQDAVMNWVSRLPFVEITADGNLGFVLDDGEKVDLTQIGPKNLQRYAVMDVVSPVNGILYLRGQSLDAYSGRGWDASKVSTGKDPYFPAQNLENMGRLRVATRLYLGRKYTPYYISEGYDLVDGAMDNVGGLEEYGYYLMRPKEGAPHLSNVDMSDPILSQCLQLPDATREKAEAIVREILSGTMDTQKKAERIRDYVRDSAAYSLDTPRMPAEAEDFAIWFLEESDTGYCVHFATALTVLLRAADIPARYVTGYTVEAMGGKTVVRASDAHAWVEYLNPQTGWTVLDATPPAWMQIAQPETQPVQTEPEPTEQETQAPTESPTEPVTEPETTTAATTPVGDAEPGEEKTADIRWLLVAVEILLWAGGLVALVAGQYWLRRRYRLNKMCKGKRNARALAYWQEAKRMKRITGETVPDTLKALAEKAKFSQHTLTAAELLEFKLWLENAQNKLRQKPWIIRMVIRLIWAIE